MKSPPFSRTTSRQRGAVGCIICGVPIGDNDALAAAPAHHRLALENERVRVLETRVEPGEVVPVHTHCWSSALYVLSWSDFVRRDAHGAILLDTRVTGPSLAAG